MSIYIAHYRIIALCTKYCWNRCIFSRK